MPTIICRVCLKETDPSKNKPLIPLNKDTNYNDKNIVDMLSFCVPELRIDLEQESSMCTKCLKKLNKLHEFKKLCLQNEPHYHQKHQNKLNLNRKSLCSSSTSDSSSHAKYNGGGLDNSYGSDKIFNLGKDLNPLQNKIKKKKRLPTYKKRFTSTVCFGCQNKIRDAKYHSPEPRNNNCVCFNCGKSFPSITEIRKHMYNSHLYLHKCEICDKKWKDNYQLSQHLKTHTKEKPFKCPECGKQFVQSYNLEQHLALHKGNKFNDNKCDECGKIFSTKYNMKIHRTLHSGNRPKCSYCSKWFYTESALLKHVKTCFTIKKENEIFVDEPQFIKTEVLDYIKQEDMSDDDVFIEEAESKNNLSLHAKEESC